MFPSNGERNMADSEVEVEKPELKQLIEEERKEW